MRERVSNPPCIMCFQYIGGYSVHQGVFNTTGITLSASGGCHEYIGRCSVHQGDMMHVREQVDENLSISIENLDHIKLSMV